MARTGGSQQMEIQQLRHIVAAARSASYAQAAKKSFTSRQNIAHSVKVIENELNIVLFQRRGNEMVLTPGGVQVIKQAKEIIEKVDGLQAMFDASGSLVAPLSLAVSTNLFAGIPSSADSLFSEHPGGIRIFELDCEGCYEYVCSGRVDAALVMCMKRTFPHCDALEIASSTSFALTADPPPGIEQMSISDLQARPLLLMSQPDFQYVTLMKKLDAIGYDRTNVQVITSTSSMIHMIRRSRATSIVSEKFSYNPPEGLFAIPLPDPELDWHFYLLYRMNASNARSIAKLGQDVQRLFDIDGGCGDLPL